MQLENGWTGKHYSYFRVALGVYLLAHFAQLLPWGKELFSNQGMLGEASVSPFYPLFPNILFVIDSTGVVTGLLVLAMALSALLIVGQSDRVAAIGLWYVWACLFSRNPLISNPSIPFIGWMLLAHACLPRGPTGSLEARRNPKLGEAWRFSGSVYLVAWIVMSIGYTYSGLAKLTSPSWVDGTALIHILDNPLARPTFIRELALSSPEILLKLGAWGGLALEILFAPLALFSRLRPVLWISMVGMHLTLMVLIDFPDLSQGMLLLHGFTFDPGWLKGHKGLGSLSRRHSTERLGSVVRKTQPEDWKG
jgi:hypothetical protein